MAVISIQEGCMNPGDTLSSVNGESIQSSTMEKVFERNLENSGCQVNRLQTMLHFLFLSLFSQPARTLVPWRPCLPAYPAFQASPPWVQREKQAPVTIPLSTVLIYRAVNIGRFQVSFPLHNTSLASTEGQSRSSTPSTMTCDPATCPIIPGCETTIDISKGRTGLGLSIVGGCDTLLVRDRRSAW